MNEHEDLDPTREPGDPFPEPEVVAPTATGQLASLLSGEEHLAASLEQREEIVLQSIEGEKKIDWWVVGIAGIAVLAVVVWGLTFQDSFARVASNALGAVVNNFGWAFVLFGTIFVLFVIAIAASRFGTIRLGAIDEQPEFRTVSWVSMMFAAGMGIGLMFYGAAEPLTFYRDGIPGHAPREVGTAMASALFHWTLHPWAVYAIVGLAIAYSTFRIGRKQLLSAAFTPLIGTRLAEGWLGKLIDILSIFATIFGTACSLGLGALQIGAGLNASGLIEDPSAWVITGIVLVLTLAFLLSAVSGVGRGIQYISNANMVLAALLAIFVFILGPTVAMLNLLPSSIGAYLAQFFEMAGRTAVSADGTAGDWLASNTIFYWAWWISWSPFVGMFLARISRGRTIREFAIYVMLVPSVVSVVWFSIFGGAAITFEQDGRSIWGDGSAESQLFNLLHELPGGTIMSFVAMLLLGLFFITSADSASTVMASIAENGRSDASPWLAAVWGSLTAAIGLTLLVSGGNDALGNLQNVTIIAASPFLLIIVALMFAIVKSLSNDVIYLEYREQQRFQRQLARERRLHRERMERESQRARLRPPRPKRG